MLTRPSWEYTANPEQPWLPIAHPAIDPDKDWRGVPPRQGTMNLSFYANHHLFLSAHLTTDKHDSSFFSFIARLPRSQLCDFRGIPYPIIPLGRLRPLSKDDISSGTQQVENVRRYARAVGLFEFKSPRSPSGTFRIIRAHVYGLSGMRFLKNANCDQFDPENIDHSCQWVWPDALEPWRLLAFPDHQFPHFERVLPCPSIDTLQRAQQCFPEINLVNNYLGEELPFNPDFDIDLSKK